MHLRRTLGLGRWLTAAAVLGGIVLVYQRWLHVNQTTVALSLLLLVLVLAAEWGLRYAVVCALAAAACYNFFFLPPFNTFSIAETQNWIALVAFLVTAIIASRLSQQVRDEAEDARQRQRELDVLYRLSRELFQSESYAALTATLPSTVLNLTAARWSCLYLIEEGRLYQSGGAPLSEGAVSHLAKVAASLETSQRRGDELRLPLRSGARRQGLFLLRAPEFSMETADSVASLISLALDRAQALEKVARSEAAKESERMRTLMIDSITHELRTPLTSIKGAATSLLTGSMSREGTTELLSIIDEESDRLNRLVSEAVAMSQLDAHEVQMHLQAESVFALLQRAVEACGWIRSQHPLQIEVPRDISVRVDPVFFEKVLCNLLENAAKYSAAGAPIAVSAERRDDRVLLSVTDRGTGIDEAEQQLIFERFYRARSQMSRVPGTGMGLAISRAIVHAHGGEIAVVSHPGRGSVFTVTMPSAAAGTPHAALSFLKPAGK